MRHIIVLLSFIFINGCYVEQEKKVAELIVNKAIYDDCNLWVEKIYAKSTYIRAGYSGACKDLSIMEYSKRLNTVFNNYGINKNNHPNIRLFYVNSYRIDGKLTDDLVKAASQSKFWDINNLNCNSKYLSEKFKSFNGQEKYLSSIEYVISSHFYPIMDVDFEGILPYKLHDDVTSSKCIPDSFGVAAIVLIND